MSGKRSTFPAAAFFLLAFISGCWRLPASSAWEWRIGYGAWTLSPFTTFLSRQAELLVEREVERLVDPLLSSALRLQQQNNIRFTSSGEFPEISLWRRLGGAWRIGAGAQFVRLHMPVTIDLQQSLSLIGLNLASAHTTGSGRLDISTVLLSFFVSWSVLQTEHFSFSLAPGLWLLPFNGRLKVDLQARVTSIIGDDTYDLSADETLKALRQDISGTPSLILSPALQACLAWKPLRWGGVFAAATLAQGSTVCLGFCFQI